MKRLPTFTALPVTLLIMAFALTACGGGGQSGQAPETSENEQSQPETAAQSEPESSTQQESNPGNASTESTQSGGDQSDSAAPEEEQGSGEEGSGYSVTTLDGQEVSIGAGDATALFFMAGW